MIVGWLNNMKIITGFYRDQNYNGQSFKKIISTIFHSLVRDKEYLPHFRDLTSNKLLELEHLPEYSFLNSLVFNWNDIKFNSDFENQDPKSRAAYAQQVLNSLSTNLNETFENTIKQEQTAKKYTPEEIKRSTANQKSILKYISGINTELKEYIESLHLDISKKEFTHLSKQLNEKGEPLVDKDKIFHKNRAFTELEEQEFKAKILELAAIEDKSKLATLTRKIDVFTANRRIYTHNNNEQPSIKKTAAAKKQGATVFKELVFSIPKSQAVFYDQQILKDAINDFIKERYSDYNNFYVIHKDELKKSDLDKLVSEGKATEDELLAGLEPENRKKQNFSGDHIHLFVSGFDKQGNQNLLETERKRINEFAKKQGLDIDFTKNKLSKLENILYGQMKQQEFREHFNQYLEKAGLQIVKLVERHPDFDQKQYIEGLNQANKGLLNLNNGVNDYLRSVKEQKAKEKELEDKRLLNEQALKDKKQQYQQELKQQKEEIEQKEREFLSKKEALMPAYKATIAKYKKAKAELEKIEENKEQLENSLIEVFNQYEQNINEELAETIKENAPRVKKRFGFDEYYHNHFEGLQKQSDEYYLNLTEILLSIDTTPKDVIEKGLIFNKKRKETPEEIKERILKIVKEKSPFTEKMELDNLINQKNFLIENIVKAGSQEYKKSKTKDIPILIKTAINKPYDDLKLENTNLKNENDKLKTENNRLNNVIKDLNNTVQKWQNWYYDIRNVFKTTIQAVLNNGHTEDLKWQLQREKQQEALELVHQLIKEIEADDGGTDPNGGTQNIFEPEPTTKRGYQSPKI